MTNSDPVVDKALYEKALEAAVFYKRGFHELQAESQEWQHKFIAQTKILRRQREIIRDLEAKLGIDDEL